MVGLVAKADTHRPNNESQSPFRTLALSVYLPSLLLSFCNGLLLPVLPLFADSFEVSYSLIGIVLAGEAIGTLLADLPAGALIRRLDRKWVMALGVALVGGGVLALVWSTTIWQVLGWRLVAGFGGALWNLSRHAYLSEVTSRANRGRAISLYGGTNRIGTFAGPAVGGLVAAAFGIRAPFLVYAALAGVTIVLALLFVESGSPLIATSKPAEKENVNHLLEVLRHHHRVLLAAGTGQLLAQMIRAGRRIVIPLYGSSVLGLGVEAVGLIMSVSAFVDMSLFYPAGLIMDRLGRKFAIVPCFAIQAFGMLLVPFASSFAMLLLAASVMGFGNGLGSGSMMTLGSDLAPEDSLGEFLGVWRLIGDGGFMGGPLIVGAVADVVTLGPAAVVMAAVGLLSAAVFAFAVPETHRPARRAKTSL